MSMEEILLSFSALATLATGEGITQYSKATVHFDDGCESERRMNVLFDCSKFLGSGEDIMYSQAVSSLLKLRFPANRPSSGPF